MDPWIFVNRDTIRKFPTASHILLTNCFSTFNLYRCASNFLWRYSAGLRKWKCSAWVEILTSLRYWLHQRIFRLVIRFTIHLWLEVLSSRSSSKFQNVYIGKEDLWNQEGWEIKRIVTIGDTGKNKTEKFSDPVIFVQGWISAFRVHNTLEGKNKPMLGSSHALCRYLIHSLDNPDLTDGC